MQVRAALGGSCCCLGGIWLVSAWCLCRGVFTLWDILAGCLVVVSRGPNAVFPVNAAGPNFLVPHLLPQTADVVPVGPSEEGGQGVPVGSKVLPEEGEP